MTRALVVGYGSIGQRHARILRELDCEIGIVSRRELADVTRFPTVAEGINALSPDYVVVANETAEHLNTVAALTAAGFGGILLVEKPLGEGAPIRAEAFAFSGVGYNLRFHPLLTALAEELQGQRLVSMEVYCGQYLPDWRPGTDYRAGYSSDPLRGGGVLRDLSHELDYLLWLAGAGRRVAAIGGRFGELDIASDDSWAIVAELERCPLATIQINYLDRPGRRRITVNTASHTYSVDFGAATLTRDGTATRFEVDRDTTYRAMHRAVLACDGSRLCTISEGEKVMALISALEEAALRREWVAL